VHYYVVEGAATLVSGTKTVRLPFELTLPVHSDQLKPRPYVVKLLKVIYGSTASIRLSYFEKIPHPASDS